MTVRFQIGWLWLLGGGAWLLGPMLAWGQQAPEGFQVELLYQVPEIEHPSAVTCDAAGNLFVGEDPMDMRGPSKEPIDRVLMIRWDAAGGPPRKTVFGDRLSAVFGLLWYDDAMYVMNAPYYTRLKDLDGDGVADERTVLNDTLGHSPGLFGLNNHVPTGLCLGMDGYVYVAVGDKGLPKAVGSDGSTITLEGGGVFRMKPDATRLELVSHGIRNNMDAALDPHDNIFAFDNDDDYGWWMRVVHHVPTGYYGYPYDYRSHRRRFLPPVGEFGGGTACGGACYVEAAWPSQYRGNAFFCDLGEGKIERYELTRKGATFTARGADFLVGDQSGEFRPIDLCFSPDGQHMYVADWNETAGGKAKPVGRLYRVTYVGNDVPPEPPRGHDSDPLENQLRALAHPARYERLRAQRQLARLGQTAIEPVAQLLKSDDRAAVRIQAIWVQHALAETVAGYDPTPNWIAALGDVDVEVRAQAARSLGLRKATGAEQPLAAALHDAEAAVRMQAAIALGRLGQPSASGELYAALGESDEFARFTIVEALRAIGDWPTALLHLRSAELPMRSQILATLDGVFDARATDVLLQWIAEAPTAAERAAALRSLAKVHRRAAPYTGGWWGGKAAGGQPSRPPDQPWEATPRIHAAVAAGLRHELPELRIAALAALREVPADEHLADARRLLDDSDGTVRQQAIRWLAERNDQESLPVLLRLAADQQTDLPVREAALRAVLAADLPAHQAAIIQLALADQTPAALVLLTLDALAALGDPQAAQAIEQRLADPRAELRAKAAEALACTGSPAAATRLIPLCQDANPAVQRAALAGLTVVLAAAASEARQAVLETLAQAPDRRALPIYLEALADAHPPTREAARTALRAVGGSIQEDLRTRHDRQELSAAARQELKSLFAAADGFGFLADEPAVSRDLAEYERFALEHSGNVERGRQLFENAKGIGCAKCHVVGGAAGEQVGPNLLGVGAKYPRRELIRSVLEPSARVLTDFEMLVVTTTRGQVHQGMLRSQTPSRIELVTTEGAAVAIPVEEIEQRETTSLSPMPNGLANGMTLENFADIIAFLESLKQPFTAGGE